MLPHELCSRLTNASMARNRYVPVPATRQNFALLNILVSHGFLSSLSYRDGSRHDQTDDQSQSKLQITPDVFAELKFREDRPVLNKMRLVSRPSRRVWMENDEMRRFLRGSRVKFVPGLTTGEIVVIKEREGSRFLEGREALREGIGGEVIARVG